MRVSSRAHFIGALHLDCALQCLVPFYGASRRDALPGMLAITQRALLFHLADTRPVPVAAGSSFQTMHEVRAAAVLRNGDTFRSVSGSFLQKMDSMNKGNWAISAPLVCC
jgi:hypothetical protein